MAITTLAGVPTAAQSVGPTVLACVADDDDAVQLSQFGKVVDARNARAHAP